MLGKPVFFDPTGKRARLLRAVAWVAGTLSTIIIVLFAILAANLFHLTVIRHSFYQDQALENRQDRFRVRAPRGRIYDRDVPALRPAVAALVEAFHGRLA